MGAGGAARISKLSTERGVVVVVVVDSLLFLRRKERSLWTRRRECRKEREISWSKSLRRPMSPATFLQAEKRTGVFGRCSSECCIGMIR